MNYDIRTIALCLTTLCCAAGNATEYDADKALTYCENKVNATVDEMKAKNGSLDYRQVPWHILKGEKKWDLQPVMPQNWTCGFWAGELWYAYEATGDSRLKELAESYTLALDTLVRQPIFDHDLGFLIYCGYGNAYRMTGDKRYGDVIVDAAKQIATLYRPKVGTILSWPRNVKMFGGHNTIMDNMMNLETLFNAYKLSGNRHYYDMAVSHAATTMRYHFRPDYSCYHVAVYDTLSGAFKRGVTHQGYADDTMWARGQSWAIYGYTMVYRETKDPVFLDFAQKVTDVYLKRLPEDLIPYWDFDDPKIPNSFRDVSTACIVASALIELSEYVDHEKGAYYLDMAKRMLNSLDSETYQSRKKNSAMLLHSVGNLPAGTEIDASICYADYYYMEALVRLKNAEQGRSITAMVN